MGILEPDVAVEGVLQPDARIALECGGFFGLAGHQVARDGRDRRFADVAEARHARRTAANDVDHVVHLAARSDAFQRRHLVAAAAQVGTVARRAVTDVERAPGALFRRLGARDQADDAGHLIRIHV